MADERIDALERRVAALEEVLAGGPRTVFMQDVIRWRLIAALPELMAKHPNGVEVSHVAAHFDASKATTTIVLRNLTKAGKIQWVRRRGTNTKIVLPLGAPVPPRGLTKQQKLVMDAIMAREGTLKISIYALAKELNVNPNTVTYTMGRLVEDGKLEFVARQASRWEPHVYRIVKGTTEADIWKAAFAPRKPSATARNADHAMAQTAPSRGYDQ